MNRIHTDNKLAFSIDVELEHESTMSDINISSPPSNTRCPSDLISSNKQFETNLGDRVDVKKGQIMVGEQLGHQLIS